MCRPTPAAGPLRTDPPLWFMSIISTSAVSSSATCASRSGRASASAGTAGARRKSRVLPAGALVPGAVADGASRVICISICRRASMRCDQLRSGPRPGDMFSSSPWPSRRYDGCRVYRGIICARVVALEGDFGADVPSMLRPARSVCVVYPSYSDRSPPEPHESGDSISCSSGERVGWSGSVGGAGDELSGCRPSERGEFTSSARSASSDKLCAAAATARSASAYAMLPSNALSAITYPCGVSIRAISQLCSCGDGESVVAISNETSSAPSGLPASRASRIRRTSPAAGRARAIAYSVRKCTIARLYTSGSRTFAARDVSRPRRHRSISSDGVLDTGRPRRVSVMPTGSLSVRTTMSITSGGSTLPRQGAVISASGSSISSANCQRRRTHLSVVPLVHLRVARASIATPSVLQYMRYSSASVRPPNLGGPSAMVEVT